MVRGIDKFRDFFKDFSENYIVIDPIILKQINCLLILKIIKNGHFICPFSIFLLSLQR